MNKRVEEITNEFFKEAKKGGEDDEPFLNYDDIASFGKKITGGRPAIAALGGGLLGGTAGYLLGPTLADMFSRVKIPGVKAQQRLTPNQKRQIGYKTGILGTGLGMAPFVGLALSMDNPLGRISDEPTE